MGQMPNEMALTAASWIACVAPPAGFDPGEIAAEMEEPQRENLAKATAGAKNTHEHVEKIMTGGFFPTELGEHAEFTDRVAELLDIIVTDGVEAAANNALGE
ncbi:hypothetical protein SDC9_160911 [bioreactor metagenome]